MSLNLNIYLKPCSTGLNYNSAIFHTEPVQVVTLFSKELAFLTGTVHFLEVKLLRKSCDMTLVISHSCESLPDFLTIADLDQSDVIEPKHLLEALQYRVKL